MDYLLLSNWELSKFTYSSEIFNFLKTQVSNTIPSFFLFFILFPFWVTEFSCSTCTIIYRPSSTSQRTSNYPNTTLSRNSFWISSRSTIAPVTIRINSNNSQPFARASQLTDIKRFEIEQNPKAKEKRKPAARSFCNNKETEIEGGGEGGGEMAGSSREFFNGPCVPEAAIRAKSSEGFSPRWYYRKRSDVLLYRDAVVRDPIDGYGRAAPISRVIRSDKGIHCEGEAPPSPWIMSKAREEKADHLDKSSLTKKHRCRSSAREMKYICMKRGQLNILTFPLFLDRRRKFSADPLSCRSDESRHSIARIKVEIKILRKISGCVLKWGYTLWRA